jgi:hypothetical protein
MTTTETTGRAIGIANPDLARQSRARTRREGELAAQKLRMHKRKRPTGRGSLYVSNHAEGRTVILKRKRDSAGALYVVTGRKVGSERRSAERRPGARPPGRPRARTRP